MRMAFEDEFRERVKQLPVLDAGSLDFDAMDRKWAAERTKRKRRNRRLMAAGSIVAAMCITVGVGIATPTGWWAKLADPSSHATASDSSNQFELSFIPLTSATPIQLQHVAQSAQTSKQWVDLLIGRWPHLTSSDIAIFATSTVSNATVGVALAPGGTPSVSVDSSKVSKAYQDAANSQMHQLHLAQLDVSALFIHSSISGNEIYHRIPVVVYANKNIPFSSLRFVITDLTSNGKGGFRPRWDRVMMPSGGASLDEEVLKKLPLNVVDLRIPWSKTIGKYTYRIYTYQSGGKKYVRFLTAQQFSDGTSSILYGGTGQVARSTNPVLKNVLPFSWSSSLPNGDGRYFAFGGVVNNPQVTTVHIKFTDGVSATVPVQNGVYAYVRTWPTEKGKTAGLASTKGYTKSGKLVFSQ